MLKYSDDELTHADGEEGLLDGTDEYLDKCDKYDVKLSPKKFVLCVTTLSWDGKQMSADGVGPTPDRILTQFVITIYVPHRLRTQTAQCDTLEKLQELIQQIPKGDAVIILGDINDQLPPPDIQNHTIKFVDGPASKNAEDILNILCLHNLFAVSTKFKPSIQHI